MAVQASVKDSFTFVGGLNTEGGFFVTPENSWKEGVNVLPMIDGSVERRNGLDYESNYTLAALGITAEQKNTWAFTTDTWTSVGGNSNLDFIVFQAGTTLHFYRAASGTISNTKKAFTVNLSSYIAAGNPDTAGTSICSFASTYGRLIVTSKSTEPLIIVYNATTDTITVSTITIQIRDFVGFNTGFSVDTEKTETEWTTLGLLTQAKYNLYNQGWTDTQINAYKTANSNKLPANSKSWIYGKDTSDNFSATLLNKQDFGTSPAPKGRFVLNAFSQDRSGIINVIPYRPRVCSFFAGRVWYAGLPTTEQLGTVYFSQVLDDINKVGYCYQQNDPTSEVISDLQDSDGGTIEIPDSGEIVGLQPLGRGVLVIAANGVWFVSGIDRGFTAASYSVERVSAVGCLSGKSIVTVEDTLLYWSTGGIYAIAPGNSGAEFSSRNISDQNIKTFFEAIPVLSKLYAESSYNSTDKVIYWLYSSVETNDTSSGRFNKNTVLVLDLRLNAWYWFDIDTSLGVIPVSIEITRETNETISVYDVYVGSDDVNASTNDVVANIPIINGNRRTFKITALHPVSSNNYSVTFADFLNTRDSATKFKDWYTFNTAGVEKQGYFITGYNMGGNGPARSKTGMYLTVFMKRTETAFNANAVPLNQSGCLMQSRWDFTDNIYPNKWSDEVQVYRQLRPFFANPSTAFDDGYPLVISKNKLRGRGKAVQFKYASETGKDMKIVGWTGTFVGNTNV